MKQGKAMYFYDMAFYYLVKFILLIYMMNIYIKSTDNNLVISIYIEFTIRRQL